MFFVKYCYKILFFFYIIYLLFLYHSYVYYGKHPELLEGSLLLNTNFTAFYLNFKNLVNYILYGSVLYSQKTIYLIHELKLANDYYKMNDRWWMYDFSTIPFFFYFLLVFLMTIMFSLIFLNYLGLYGVFILNLVSLVCLWCSLCFYVKSIILDQVVYNISLGKWIFFNFNCKLNFNFVIDSISFSFMFLTITIAIFVYIYAFSYFKYEPLVDRFLIFILMFVFSMVFLVCSGNLIMMFLGWEMIGLTSFFLINFWVTRIGTLKSAFKAFTLNKISDFFFLLFILIIYNICYDVDILSLSTQLHLFTNSYVMIFNLKCNTLEVLSFCLITASSIKSAQIGFHIWLPDSMEAPVPASALIHSATLVSAGIFLLLKFSFLLESSSYAYWIIPIIGSCTAAYGGLAAAFQSDVKKILAYSTISHCGFLFFLCATASHGYVLIYLYVHGFFKAASFMCLGNVIRFSRGNQDFRKMGMFYKFLPFECCLLFLCLANLAGLPLTLGFFIKHTIFVSALTNNYLYVISILLLINLIVAALTGLFYSYRLFYNIFFDFKKGRKITYTYNNNVFTYSHFYSNSSVASIIAIFSLFFCAYFISLFFLTYLNYSLLSSDTSSLLYNSFYHNLTTSNKNFETNVSYLNWIVLITIMLIIFIKWRSQFNNYESILNFYSFLLFIIFFYFNLIVFNYFC